MKEEDLQKAVVEWAAYKKAEYPPLRVLYSQPNEGKRNRWRGWKAMGMKAGIPDLILPYPSGPYGSLYLELKAGANDLTPDQHRMIQRLVQFGNAVDVAWTLDQAIYVLECYLETPQDFVPGY